MTYSKTSWLEFGMTSAQKITALNNLETMYDQLVTYVNSILHGELYYTFAQSDVNYFTTLKDGAGSGFVAKYLDGYSAQNIIDNGIPPGTIMFWYGSIESIPSGFYLCDGNNNTPDLRNISIVGAGSHYSRGDTGGDNEIICTSASLTIANYTLQIADIPSHNHTVSDYTVGGSGRPVMGSGSYSYASGVQTLNDQPTGYTGGDQPHNHTSNFSGDTQEKMPPYKAVCIIMKG